MHCFVTGAAGFIGSSLVDPASTCWVIASSKLLLTNFSTGQRRFLEHASKSPHFRLVEADLLNTDALRAAMSEAEMVFHLAANADVRFGTHHPFKRISNRTPSRPATCWKQCTPTASSGSRFLDRLGVL